MVIKKNLILVDTDAKQDCPDQKQEWNHLWHRKYLQHFYDFARCYKNRLYLATFLKRYRTVNTFCELGCGSSVLLAQLAKDVSRVIGIDYSPEALARSRDLFCKLGIKNYQFIEADIRRLDMPEKYDVVYSNGVIEHFDDPGVLIMNHLNITKEGGCCLVVVPKKWSLEYFTYCLFRLRFLRKYWPTPDQIYFSSKKLEACYLKYHSNCNHDYKVRIFYPTAKVLLIIYKSA